MQHFWRYAFPIALVLAVIVAFSMPAPGATDGILRLQAIQPWLLAAIMLIAGAGISMRQLLQASQTWRVHVVVLGVGLLGGVLLAATAAAAAAKTLPQGIVLGIVALGVLPTTVASGIAIVRIAGGDIAAASIAAALSTLLGIALGPTLIAAILGRPPGALGWKGLETLVLQLIAPMGFGMMLGARISLPKWIGVLANVMLVVVVYHIASNAAQRFSFGREMLILLAICFGMHLSLMAVAWFITVGQERPQRIAAAILASHKSAITGVPLITAVTVGHPFAATILLPIALYHPMQMLVDALLASLFARSPQRAAAATDTLAPRRDSSDSSSASATNSNKTSSSS